MEQSYNDGTWKDAGQQVLCPFLIADDCLGSGCSMYIKGPKVTCDTLYNQWVIDPDGGVTELMRCGLNRGV